MPNSELFEHLGPIKSIVQQNTQQPHHISQLVKSSQDQIDRMNTHTNAVIWQDQDYIDNQIEDTTENASARNPRELALLGVPILVKELDSSIAGTPNSWGNSQLKQENYCDTFTSTSVLKLRNAGAIVMGKTNNPELGLTVTTQSKAHGSCNNPLDILRNSGGSSGGSAASVSSAMVGVALGSDGGGSIRIPASLCGVFGFKPTRGVISLGPFISEAWSGLVSKGLLAANLQNLVEVLNVVSESDKSIEINSNFENQMPNLRIGIRTEAFAGLYPINSQIEQAVNNLACYLENLGCQVHISNPQVYEDDTIIETFLNIISYNTFAEVEFVKLRAKDPFDISQCEDETQYFCELGKKLTKVDHSKDREALKRFAQNISSWHDSFDLLITPTTGDVAPLHGAVEQDPQLSPFVYGGLCFPSNISGAPALSIPIKKSSKNGLPFGIQVIGKTGSDNLVLNFAEFLNSDYPDIFVTRIENITT